MKLIDNFDAEYEYVTNEDTVFTFKTNLDAPRYRLINIDFASPDQSRWKELIPQHDKDVIGEPHSQQEDMSPSGGRSQKCEMSLCARSVRHLHLLQLPVCVLPPRREECAEDVPSELGGGAAYLSPGRGLSGGLHRTQERLGDLLLFHLLPVPRYSTPTSHFNSPVLKIDTVHSKVEFFSLKFLLIFIYQFKFPFVVFSAPSHDFFIKVAYIYRYILSIGTKGTPMILRVTQ